MKKQNILFSAIALILVCLSGKITAQTEDYKYVKDLETGKVYYTPTTIGPDGSIRFIAHSIFEVDNPGSEPAERLVAGGPRQTVHYDFEINGHTYSGSTTICYNQILWPCAWCANSL